MWAWQPAWGSPALSNANGTTNNLELVNAEVE
jgi:hypothetical protein